MNLTILEILYIALIFSVVLIGTLLSVVLYKLIKILKTLEEIVAIYDNIKNVLMLYSKIPDIVFRYMKDLLFGKKNKNSKI